MPTNYISKIEIDGVEYEIKDTVARQGGIKFILSTNAATTPMGVQWKSGDVTITGTLAAADADKTAFYLVPLEDPETSNNYREYIAANTGSGYVWECLGTTSIDLSDVVTNVTLNKGNGDTVLGKDTTFSNAASAVTFSGGASDTVVKSYPGTSSKLETTTIKGVGTDATVDVVKSATDYKATKTVFGTDAEASKIETETKTATNTTFGTDETVNKVSPGTAVEVAKAGSAVTNVLSGDVASVFTNATVENEVLRFTSTSVTKNSITPAVDNGTITPVSIGAQVTVPQVTSNATVNMSSVKTNTPVAVPVVSSNDEVTTTKITTESKTLATSAASATTVATGSLDENDTSGAEVMTGLGTPTTTTAITDIGTGTAAAQQITVGNNDEVDVAKYSDLSLSVTKGNH